MAWVMLHSLKNSSLMDLFCYGANEWHQRLVMAFTFYARDLGTFQLGYRSSFCISGFLLFLFLFHPGSCVHYKIRCEFADRWSDALTRILIERNKKQCDNMSNKNELNCRCRNGKPRRYGTYEENYQDRIIFAWLIVRWKCCGWHKLL